MFETFRAMAHWWRLGVVNTIQAVTFLGSLALTLIGVVATGVLFGWWIILAALVALAIWVPIFVGADQE